MEIKITPFIWKATGTWYEYRTKGEPHYLVNVSKISDGRAYTWAINAHGQVIENEFDCERFLELYERRVFCLADFEKEITAAIRECEASHG